MQKRLAILSTQINPETIQEMLQAAEAEAKQRSVSIVTTSLTVGVLDMPIIAQQLLKRADVDGLVVLGAVAKGDTQHDVVVVNTMTSAIMQLSLQFNKPVSFGVIGPNASREQFKGRTVEYATRAVEAVVRNLELLETK